jgi:hypothetical protein
MRLRCALWALITGLFLLQQVLGAADWCHDDDEVAPDSGVPTLCHTCPTDGPCPEDGGADAHHHHHPAIPHAHTLCPSCVHMFVQLPQDSARVELPDQLTRVENAAPVSPAREVSLGIVHSRAPPSDSSC